MTRYHIEFRDDPGGVRAAFYAETFDGSVQSTVRNFYGGPDRALIDVPDDQREAMEDTLRADGNVIYFTIATPSVA